jgi:hypothetical protein
MLYMKTEVTFWIALVVSGPRAIFTLSLQAGINIVLVIICGFSSFYDKFSYFISSFLDILSLY